MTNSNTSQPTSSDINVANQKRGRRMFLLMFVIFFGPFLLAALAKYYGWFAMQDTVNYGTLIQPSVLMPDAQLTIKEKAETLQLREKWSLLVVLPKDCELECVKSIREIEAIHLLLNRDIQRVQLLLLDEQNIEPGVYTNELASTAELNEVITTISSIDGQEKMFGSYLIDPKGYLVMQYPQLLDPKKLQKDLKRLLKYSRIG